MNRDEETARRLASAPDRIARDLTEIPQIKRGLLFCHHCGRQESIRGNPFGTGWPKCCNYTMSLDSPEERQAMKEAKP